MTATITLERLLNPDVNNKANFCRYVAAHRNKRAILAGSQTGTHLDAGRGLPGQYPHSFS
ncbi:MAG: hypothetical protein CTY16_12255 [Methylobacter sp.]|nr:MAG: hypothetical protein CTY16_12255 [Methylobacter sp.]